MLSSVSMALPNVYADNFQISQECDDGITTVYTSFGGEPLPKVSIFIYGNVAMNSYEGKVITDENGIAEIELTEKTNFVKLSKGGYNDTTIKLVKCPSISSLYNLQIPKGVTITIDTDKNVYDLNQFRAIKVSGKITDYSGLLTELRIFVLDTKRVSTIMFQTFPIQSDGSYVGQLDDPLVPLTSGRYIVQASYNEGREKAEKYIEIKTTESPKEPIEIISNQKVPVWVKNNAKWWAEGKIDDKAFSQGIEFLIKEKIIDIQEIPKVSDASDNSIPTWIRNGAEWWANGLISDDEFLRGIEFLVRNGIIQVQIESEVVSVEEKSPDKPKTESISLLPTKDDLNFKSYHSWKEGCDDDVEIPEKMKVCESLSFAVEDKPPIYIIHVWKFPNSIDSNQFFQTKSDAAMIIAKGVGGDFEAKNLEPMTKCYEWDIQLMGGASCVVDSYVIQLTFAEQDSFEISHKLIDSSLSKVFKLLQIENYQTLSDYSQTTTSENDQQSETTKQSDSSLLFDLEVINCSSYGTDSVKVEYSVTSNWDKTVNLELVIKGVDINGKVLSISTPGMYDLVPGQTRYDHTFIDDYPNLDSCAIGLNDASETNTPSYSYAPVDLEVISCSPYGTDSVKVEYSVTSHYDTVVDLELIIKGVDSNGEVLSTSTPGAYDLVPEHTTYDKTYIDDIPGLDSCEIGINQILD